MYRIEQLNNHTTEELIAIAQKLNIENYDSMTKQELVYKVLDYQASTLDTPSVKTIKPKLKKTIKLPSKKLNNKPVKEKKQLDKNPSKKPNYTMEKPLQATKEKSKRDPVNNKLDGIIEGEFVVERHQDGYAFGRLAIYDYLPSVDDSYISHAQIRKWNLQTGDTVRGKLRLPKEGEKYFALMEISSINGNNPENNKSRVPFESLTPSFPQKKLDLVSSPTQYSTRYMEIFCPIALGTRGLIVAPPKAGKTSLIIDIATSIVKNHPEIYLIILLVDERVEEASYMKKKFTGVAEVVASTFDKKPENHIRLTEIVLEKAKRLVESGHDVCIIADSITRITRAYNIEIRSSGKTLSGGIDVNALHKPKKFFGAARNIEDGGSLTIIATALIDTGSRMDDLIFEEFKGTGNMECVLSGRLTNLGIIPIDPVKSGTRKEELIVDPAILQKVRLLRRASVDAKLEEFNQILHKNMRGTQNNIELLASMNN